MLEVVATTPSSPLEVGVLVTLDMIPRLRELMNAGCTSQKRRLRNPLLYAKAAAVSRRRLGRKRAPGVYSIVCSLLLKSVCSPAEFLPDMEKFMKAKCLIFALILAVAAPLALADEGMWLFNAFPKEKVKAQYGFLPTQQWLDHVRLSSVRFNNGGSGSFVSADGLTFTNHHVGADCIQKLSKAGTDYMKTGFYAKTQADEAKCPDLELNVLTGIEDVTVKLNAGVKAGLSAAEAGQAQRSAMSAIEKDCATSSGLRCDVVTLYSGDVFHLYKYKKYTDVRLVFAPEFDAAFFGGDPDNFTYPRYDLDITFFRVYENDKPAHTENYLRWSKQGVRENELIFVSGHPGSTGRQRTIAQLEFLRDLDYPSRLETYKRRIALLQKFSGESEENARIAKEHLFSYQNGFK